MRTAMTTFLAALDVASAPEHPAIAVTVWESAPAFPSARTDGAAVNQNGTLVVGGGRPLVGEGSGVHYLPPGAPRCAGAAIPTVSEWGLLVMTLLMLTAGAGMLRRRQRAGARSSKGDCRR